MNTSRSLESEVPGTSPKKRRGPQTRDYVAAELTRRGLGLGSGRTWERCKHVVKRSEELRAQGYRQEADILVAALDVSKRGAYEITRLPEELQLALCQVVIAGEAHNLIEARRLVNKLVKEQSEATSELVTLERAQNGMYRIRSLHNHSSILVSARDLLHLTSLVFSILPELEEQAEEASPFVSHERY